MGSVLKHVKINSLGLKWKGAVGVLSPLASKSCEGSQRAKHARKHRLTTFGQFHPTTCFRSMSQRYSKSRWSHWKFTVEILPSPGKNGRLELKFYLQATGTLTKLDALLNLIGEQGIAIYTPTWCLLRD